MTKKCVVFGGGGFLGSHVADYLSASNFEVLVVDKNPSEWLQPNQKMLIGDILDPTCVIAAVEGADFVYNFAALADLNAALNQPILAAQINIEGNINVLEACKEQGVERFVYASTVYVHSREGGFYRCSKVASEAFVEEYYLRYGLNFTILRYGSLYGPRSDQTNGLRRIVKSAVKHRKIRYSGNKNAIREYIHVEDAAQASVDILDEKYRNMTIGLTGGQPIAVTDLLGMLAEMLDLEEDKIDIQDGKVIGHYARTPYFYKQNKSKNYTLPVYVDLGQGLLELIGDVTDKD